MTAAELRNTPTDHHPDQHLIAGRYRLLERIGRGRLGDIYSAVDEDDQSPGAKRKVAVQIVPDIVTRKNKLFNKLKTGYECLRVAAHPNLVSYPLFVRDNESVYLVMEHLDGSSLDVLLRDTGPLPLDEGLPVLRAVASALQLLHANEFVHGNLTAHNVFITNKLDVRLLDVVPLESANAIFGGGAITSRSTAADDIFALACIAYELLSGRPPFNQDNPGTLGPTGFEPDRIAALGDRQWDSLRHALALDGDEQPTSVAAFMRDFDSGDTPNEPSSNEQPVLIQEEAPVREERPVAKPAFEEQPTWSGPLASEPTSGPIVAMPEPAMGGVTYAEYVGGWPPDEEPGRSGPGPRRAVLLGVLMAVLGAWYYYGQPVERATDLIAFADENMNLGLTESDAQFVPQAGNPVATVDASETAQEETLAEIPVEEPAEGELPDVGPPAPEADVPDENIVATESSTTDGQAVSGTGEVGPPEQPAVKPAEEQTAVVSTEAVVSVSERSGVAKVWLRRNGDSKLPLVWWTSDLTARADTDYVPVAEQVVNLAPGEMLHIPLVNDDVPEQRESFYVDFGLRHTQGQIERVASVRIDIDDDDL